MNNIQHQLHKKNRIDNPTFSSKLVSSSLFVQAFTKDRFPQKYMTLKSPPNKPTFQNNHKNITNYQQRSPVVLPQIRSKVPQSQQTHRSVINNNISQIKARSYSQSQKKIHQQVRNNLKSLDQQFKKFNYSSKQIFQNQQKSFDIIKGTLKSYKSELGLFPKFRLQRLDSDFKKRQAFLRGDLNTVRKIEQRSKSQKRLDNNYMSKVMSYRQAKYEPVFVYRKREPVEFAFKITQNPEIIRKKLVLQK